METIPDFDVRELATPRYALACKRHSFVQVRVHSASVPLDILSRGMDAVLHASAINESPLRDKMELCLKCQWLCEGRAQEHSTTLLCEASPKVSLDESQGVVWGKWSPNIDFVCGVVPKGVQGPQPQAGETWLFGVDPDASITARVFVINRFFRSDSNNDNSGQQIYQHLGYFDIQLPDAQDTNAIAQVVDMRSFIPTSFDGRCYWDQDELAVYTDEQSSITQVDFSEVGHCLSLTGYECVENSGQKREEENISQFEQNPPCHILNVF